MMVGDEERKESADVGTQGLLQAGGGRLPSGRKVQAYSLGYSRQSTFFNEGDVVPKPGFRLHQVAERNCVLAQCGFITAPFFPLLSG